MARYGITWGPHGRGDLGETSSTEGPTPRQALPQLGDMSVSSRLSRRFLLRSPHYNLGHRDLVGHVGLTTSKTSAVIWYLKLQENPDYCKVITIGGVSFTRYSQKAIGAIKKAVDEIGIQEIWRVYRNRNKAKV